jgi:hypothetical protein
MNIDTTGSQRPRLHLPKALLSAGYQELPRTPAAAGRSPILSAIALRRIVAEMIG